MQRPAVKPHFIHTTSRSVALSTDWRISTFTAVVRRGVGDGSTRRTRPLEAPPLVVVSGSLSTGAAIALRGVGKRLSLPVCAELLEGSPRVPVDLLSAF